MTRQRSLFATAWAVVALAVIAVASAATSGEEKSAAPVGRDCICNKTDKTIRVFVTSGYSHFEAVLKPNQCVEFLFVKDGKDRVLSAFTLTNDLVAVYPFKPIDQTGNPTPNCLHVTPHKDGASKEGKREPGGHDEKKIEAANSPL